MQSNRITPSSHLILLVSLNGSVSVTNGNRRQSRQTHIGGLHGSARSVESSGDPFGLRVAVNPLWSRRLFGVPASALSNDDIDSGELFGQSRSNELLERLHETGGWDERFDVLDHFLSARLGHSKSSSTKLDVSFAWQQIVASRGMYRVDQLASEIGCSRKYLSRRFSDEFGVSPKKVLQLARFEHACALFKSDPTQAISAVASLAGFADQAHLTRSWQTFNGCTPSAWLKEEFPFLQDYEFQCA